jgi:beta-glucanase (GH16 family)
MFTKTIALFVASVYAAEVLVFEDNFDKLDFKKWQHEITMGGGGNWEFEMYVNRRQNSFVKDGVLYIQPTTTADNIGEAAVKSGSYSLWGGSPADLCTSNQFWGCERTAGGTNIINPIQSARLRTVNSFNFKYGRVEVRAQLPKGDWIWPAIWMLPTD